MGVDFSKSSHLWFFGGVLPLTSWYISNQIFIFFPNWPNWLEGPSPLLIYGLLFFIFNKYLWRWGIFSALGIVWFPNINGRWSGFQTSSYKEKNGTNKQVEGRLEIKQTFSKINVKAYYKQSESESVTANFTNLNDEVYLFYSYDNDPSSLRVGTMAKHRGTVKLKKLPTENKIKGSYWNSLCNYGELDYEFEQKDLLGHF